MGLFGKKKSSEMVIQGELINNSSHDRSSGNSNNKLPEWTSTIVYTHGEFSACNNFYVDSVDDSNDINKITKSAGDEYFFFKSSKEVSSVGLRYTSENNQGRNMILERIAYGTIFSNFSTKSDEQIDFAIQSQSTVNLQAILICGFCLTIPLFPNEIIGFRTEDKRLKFICDQCSCDTQKKYYPVDEILKNNLTYLKNVKIVKNMKEFKPTTFITDFDDKPRPTVTHVEKLERDSIKVGEENDLRKAKKLEITQSEARKRDTSLLLLDLKKRDAAEFDKVLEELNTFEKTSNVNEVFDTTLDKDISEEKIAKSIV